MNKKQKKKSTKTGKSSRRIDGIQGREPFFLEKERKKRLVSKVFFFFYNIESKIFIGVICTKRVKASFFRVVEKGKGEE